MLNKKMTIEHILLELRDGPQFRVAILTYRDQRLVVQPGQSGHLTLSVGICNQSVGFHHFSRHIQHQLTFDDDVFRRFLHRPDDDARVQTAAGDQQRIGGPSDAVDAGVVETPLLIRGELMNSSRVN
jgi:hypothetical protein